MKRYLVLILALLLFSLGKLEARCVSISDPDDLMTDVSQKFQLQIVKEITFQDGQAGKGRAVVRQYVATTEPEHSQFDMVLYRADGRINRVMPLNDSPTVEAASIKTVTLEPHRDGLYLEYPPLAVGQPAWWWMAILDTDSCEWVGIAYAQQGKKRVVKEQMNWSDPRFKNHRAYIEKQLQ